MSKVRYFFLSMNVLNGLLAAVVVAVVLFAVVPFLDPAAVSLPAAKEKAAVSGGKAASIQSLRPAPADYAVIIEQNLFHPERKVPPEKQQEKVLPKPDLVLYGTLIADNASYAFVEDRKAPYSTAGRGKRQITLKKGESLGGYILREIDVDRIVLVKGEEKLVVRLDEQEKRKANEVAVSTATAGSTTPGGIPPLFQQAAPSPRATPPSARAVTLPAPGQQQLPKIAPSAQTEQPSAPAPGIGGSGTWPPTQSSVEQTQQRLREGRLLRMEQMQKQQQ